MPFLIKSYVDELLSLLMSIIGQVAARAAVANLNVRVPNVKASLKAGDYPKMVRFYADVVGQ